jgi:GlcNAc-P-P-Und epimerase
LKILITGGSGFIGTNLIEQLHNTIPQNTILNLDIKPPLNIEQKEFWQPCDLLDFSKVDRIMAEYLPDLCVHLAAETEMKNGTNIISNYPVNTNGSEQFLRLLKKYNVKRTIVVSTQYVCGPSKKMPSVPNDYWPHTEYGESKVILEINTRKILDPGSFIIVRPTYVWGPWHFKNFLDLVKVLEKGFYVHPSGHPILRSYGYVKNVCSQIVGLLLSYGESVDLFYVGDPVMDSYEFVNRLSLGLRRKSVFCIPRFLLRLLSKVGDLFEIIGKSPINSFRYRNMVSSYETPMDTTIATLGKPLYSFEDAVSDFCIWRKNQLLHDQNKNS